MFFMSKEELVARLQTTANADITKFTDAAQSQKLFLLTQAGIMSCSDVNLRSYDDVLQDVKTKNSFNLLDFALATPLPGDAKIEKVKKTFLYCVDVDFLPNSGGNLISLPAICIDLDRVCGFSVGTLQSR